MTPPCISRLAAPSTKSKSRLFWIQMHCTFHLSTCRFQASILCLSSDSRVTGAETCWDMLRPLKSFKENWDAKCDARNCSEVLTVQSHSMSSRLEVTGGGPCSLTARLYPWALRRKYRNSAQIDRYAACEFFLFSSVQSVHIHGHKMAHKSAIAE